MIEIDGYLLNLKNKNRKEDLISLSGKLEGIIGNYFVSAEGKADTVEYGITYIEVNSFDKQILQCCNPSSLSKKLLEVEWIDDGFMDNENIPFDYDAFEKIDDGIIYLNPKHFSVKELIKAAYLKKENRLLKS